MNLQLGFLPDKTYFARTVVSRVVLFGCTVTPHLVELWTFCTREEKKGVAWPRRRWGDAVAETESGARWPRRSRGRGGRVG